MQILGEQPETRWEAANRQRRLFTTPAKDAVGGVMVGIITFVLALLFAASEITAKSVGIAIAASLMAAVALPQVEALYYWFRVPLLRAEEEAGRAREETQRLIEQVSSRMPPAVTDGLNRRRTAVPSGQADTSDQPDTLPDDIKTLWWLSRGRLFLKFENFSGETIDGIKARLVNLDRFAYDVRTYVEADLGWYEADRKGQRRFIEVWLSMSPKSVVHGHPSYGEFAFLNGDALRIEGHRRREGARANESFIRHTRQHGTWRAEFVCSVQGKGDRRLTLHFDWLRNSDGPVPVEGPKI